MTIQNDVWQRLLFGRGWLCRFVDPVASAGVDEEPLVSGRGERDGVEAGVRRLWLEAEDIAVGDMVGDRREVVLEGLLAAEFVVLAARELGDRFWDIVLDGVAQGNVGHVREAEWRREHGDTVERLL